MHALEIAALDNVAEELDKYRLDEIGGRVVQEYDIDKRSMRAWMDQNEEALKLVRQDFQTKSEPWEKAANTKLPLVLNAAMKASAEEYAEILKGKDLVKTQVFGVATEEKTARADRVTRRMNFQYHYELEGWEEDHDRLIMVKNLLGTVHKKYFFSAEKDRPDCVLRINGVVINDNARSLEEAPRITDEIEMFGWEVEEKVRSGEWRDLEWAKHSQGEFAESDDMQLFLEQIRREDLDDDGYPEPYVITVHKETQQVVRIVPNFTEETIWFRRERREPGDLPPVVRIESSRARVRYVKYSMIPSYEGGYWGFGFGILLGPLNDNCNTLVNQLLDAGTLSNLQGGFISQSFRDKSGEIRFRPGEWKKVNVPGGVLKDSVLPLPIKEPSQTLFQLLGLLMEVLKDLSSVTEIMSGEQPRSNMAGSSVLALLEQGRKVFNSIYKRHYRALKKEFNALYDLNYLYESPQIYQEFLDQPADPQRDFDRSGLDLMPVAQAEFSSRIQRMAQAEALFQLADRPEVNQSYIMRMYVEGVTDDKETAEQVVPEQPNMTPQQVLQQMEVAKQQLLDSAEARKAEAESMKAEIELQRAAMEAEQAGLEAPLKTAREAWKTAQAEAKAMEAEAKLYGEE